ncbi:MAG: glycosyltransferase family 4 protein [Planctomycetota bacterium]|nr:glycosyltransferase family 4 protein [Planctomycetota bacterium]
MRIDLLTTELHVGGAEKCFANLARFLKQRGHSVRVISLMPRPIPGLDSLARSIEDHSIPVEYLGVESKWQIWQLTKSLKALVDDSPPDIAQSFLFHSNVLASMVYPQHNIPIVGGERVADPRRFRAWVTKAAVKRMARLVCVSQSVALHCEHREGITRDKLIVIPNGIDVRSTMPASEISTFAQRQLALPRSTPCLLFVGRIDYQKGIDGLVSHADDLLNKLPQFQIIIIGEGPLRSVLQTQASQLRNEARIHFVGQQSNVLEWMRSSKLLLLPSRYEGMPNVVLEAMAVGLPVATTRAEGIVETLGPAAEDQCVLIDAWEEWIEMVVRLATDRELASRIGIANRKRCEEYFDLDNQLLLYEKTYQEVLDERAKSRLSEQK